MRPILDGRTYRIRFIRQRPSHLHRREGPKGDYAAPIDGEREMDAPEPTTP